MQLQREIGSRIRDESGIATTSVALIWWVGIIAIPFVYAVIVSVIWVGNAEQGTSNLAKQMARAYVLAPTSKGATNARNAAEEVWDRSGCAVFNVCVPHGQAHMSEIPPEAGRCFPPQITTSGYGAGETVTVRVACEFQLRLPGGIVLPHTFTAENVQIFETNRFPDRANDMRKDLRGGKVLIDWSQNHPTKTTVTAFLFRAQRITAVSVPLLWDEVEAVVSSGNAGPARFQATQHGQCGRVVLVQLRTESTAGRNCPRPPPLSPQVSGSTVDSGGVDSGGGRGHLVLARGWTRTLGRAAAAHPARTPKTSPVY